jgi:hypothetical protein
MVCLQQFRGYSVGITREGFMNYAVEMISGGCYSRMMTIISSIQVILRLLPQVSERLQCG